jgi:hypothetical protein
MTTATCSRPRLGPKGRAALHLVACCPRIPTDVADQLLRFGYRGSAAQILARLHVRGLVQPQTVRSGTVPAGRTLRLWSLTASGRALVAARKLGPEQGDVESLPYGAPDRARDAARQAVPLLVAAYRALGVFAETIALPTEVRAWEQPWTRSFLLSGERHPSRHAHVAAAAVLHVKGEPGLESVLVLPDLGAAPVLSYRLLLRRLIDCREGCAAGIGGVEPLLVVVTVTGWVPRPVPPRGGA